MPRTSDSQAQKRFPVLGFYSYLNRYKSVFLPATVALFATASLSLAFPFFLGQLIGGGSLSSSGIILPEVLDRINETILWLLAALALQAIVSYWRVRGFIKAGESALNDLRQDVFHHLIHLPMDFFEGSRTGELSNRVAGDLAVLRETLLTTIPQFVRHTVILIGGLAFVFVSSWKLALFMLALVPVVVLAVAFFGRKVRTYSKDAQDSLAASSVVIEESTQGIADLKAFTNENFEKSRYAAELDNHLNVVMKGARTRAAFIAFIIFVMFGTISLVVWYGAGMLARDEITSDAFSKFILFSIFVGASLGAFPEVISQIQKANGATERLKEILALPLEGQLGRDQVVKGAVRADSLEFAYPSRPELPVLRQVDFSIEPGERAAFVGPSGSGKSTLFSLLLRFHNVQKGELKVDGISVEEWALPSLRNAIAVVPQDVLLFGGTISENIRYGRYEATQEEIETAAREANASGFIESFSEGYETIVGPRGMRLSGGQRQRIAIARAILANPKILLLDEATSALDSESERQVQEAFERLMAGRTCLIIAHRLATVQNCDRIHVIQNGRIVESGTHEALLNTEGAYRHLAETQLLANH